MTFAVAILLSLISILVAQKFGTARMKKCLYQSIIGNKSVLKVMFPYPPTTTPKVKKEQGNNIVVNDFSLVVHSLLWLIAFNIRQSRGGKMTGFSPLFLLKARYPAAAPPPHWQMLQIVDVDGKIIEPSVLTLNRQANIYIVKAHGFISQASSPHKLHHFSNSIGSCRDILGNHP